MKKTLLMLFCMALFSVSALAAKTPKSIHVTPSKIHTPSQTHNAALKTIFSNLGPSGNTYYDGDGWLVAGPDSELGESQFIALPFTPAKNATVTQIQVAVGYDGAGANQFILSLNNSSSGSVGTVIEQKTIKNAPTFGTCCTLVVWKLKTAQAVTAGTLYFVVAQTAASGTGDDFYGAWAFSVNDTFFYNVDGEGWTDSTVFTGIPAGAVLGTE